MNWKRCLVISSLLFPLVTPAQEPAENPAMVNDVLFASFEGAQDSPAFIPTGGCVTETGKINASAGETSLRINFPKSAAPDRGVIVQAGALSDWSGFAYLKGDIFVEAPAPLDILTRIQSNKVFFYGISLKPGWNKDVTLADLNVARKTIDLAAVKNFYLFAGQKFADNFVIYLDNIRLIRPTVAINEKFEDAASLENWRLNETGKMELAGQSVKPFEGKDCLKLVPVFMEKDKKRIIIHAKEKLAASPNARLKVSCAVRGDGQGQSGYVILYCYDAAGKMIKAFWNPLTVTSDWKTMTADILLDEKAVTAPGLASIQLSIICYGEGACYIDDISVSPKL